MAIKKNEVYVPGPRASLIKITFDLETNKKNYQDLLQNLAALKVTRDNVNDDLSKEGREVLKALTEKKDELSKEPLKWHEDIMYAYKGLAQPLKEHIDRIAIEKKSVSAIIDKENAEQLAEKNRINAAKKSIIDFTNKIANLIIAAKTDTDIVIIEKMIGSEKTKTTVYHEFINDLQEKCDELRPAIKEQKENIRSLQKIEEAEKNALQSGNIEAQTELRGKREKLEEIIGETAIRIHETAFDQASTIEIIVPEIVDTAPKGRTNWKWRVDDMALLQKKMPHLVKLMPNDEAIDLLLATKRKDGSLDGKIEEKYFGITFYNDKSYTR